MRTSLEHTRAKDQPSAFDLWVGKVLRSEYEPVLHEAIPDAILDALPPQQD